MKDLSTVKTYKDLLEWRAKSLQQVARSGLPSGALDFETYPLVPDFVKLHKHGFMTTDSQPSHGPTKRYSRKYKAYQVYDTKFYVIGYFPKAQAQKLIDFMRRQGDVYTFVSESSTGKVLYDNYPRVDYYNLNKMKYVVMKHGLEQGETPWKPVADFPLKHLRSENKWNNVEYLEYPTINHILKNTTVEVYLAAKQSFTGSPADPLLKLFGESKTRTPVKGKCSIGDSTILNPKTGRCVNILGRVGRKILKEQRNK